MRLDKFLCDCGIGTRSEVKNYISKGRVKIEGISAKLKPDTSVDESSVVCFDGQTVYYEKFHYYLLNKPKGYITATEDSREKTVMELLTGVNLKNLSPVGRLDKDTEGLLLLTDDGQLSHHLLSPKHHVDKTYYLEVDNTIPDEAVEKFKTGVDIGDDKLTEPARLEILDDKVSARLTIHEGRFHQVKRMMEAVGCTVTYLRRESMGSVTLGDLKLGSFIKINRSDITD